MTSHEDDVVEIPDITPQTFPERPLSALPLLGDIESGAAQGGAGFCVDGVCRLPR